MLSYLNLGNLGKIPGLIGLVGGVIGFVLTLVYVIESGLVFNDIEEPDNSGKYDTRIDSDGAFLKWDDTKSSYTCIFYDEDNKDSLYRKFSDYGNKYLSYNKDVYFETEEKYKDFSYDKGCNLNDYTPTCSGSTSCSTVCGGFGLTPCRTQFLTLDWTQCKNIVEKKTGVQLTKINNCDKIYNFNTKIDKKDYKILYDRWLTSIILSCFILL